MSEAISQATFVPHQPARGGQRAANAANDGENAFGNALDAPGSRADGKTVKAPAEDADTTPADGDGTVEDETQDESGATGRFVHILAMTGSGQWQFRFMKDGAKGDGVAAEPDGANATARAPSIANVGDNDTAAGTGVDKAEGEGKGSGEVAVRGDVRNTPNGADQQAQAPESTQGSDPVSRNGGTAPGERLANQPPAAVGDAGAAPKAAQDPRTETQPRAATDARARALSDAAQQHGAGNSDTAGRGGGRDSGNEAGHGRSSPEPQAGDAAVTKVKVVGIQNAPAPAVAAAPAAHGASQTGAELVKTLDADPAFRAAASDASQANVSGRPEVMHSLKLQLQPASMGTVTATLRLVGDQLAVEIQTDNTNAHHRLATDSDSMAKALRALGFDVDRVTVHQAAPQHATGSGTDAQSGGGARQNTFQSHGSNTGDNPTSQGREKGHDGQQNAGQNRGRAQGQPESSRSGLYI